MIAILNTNKKQKYLRIFKTQNRHRLHFVELNGINPKTLARWIYQQRLEAKQSQTSVEFVEVKRTFLSSGKIIIRNAGLEICFSEDSY